MSFRVHPPSFRVPGNAEIRTTGRSFRAFRAFRVPLLTCARAREFMSVDVSRTCTPYRVNTESPETSLNHAAFQVSGYPETIKEPGNRARFRRTGAVEQQQHSALFG